MQEVLGVESLDKETQVVVDNFPVSFKSVPISSVFPNKWNPNVQNELTFKTLVNSVKKVGFIDPILVRSVGDIYEIIDGEHKWKAAQECGYNMVLVADLGVIDDNLAKTLTLSMNMIRGTHDVLKQAELLKQIKNGQKDLFGIIPLQEKEIEAQLALLDFDFSQFEDANLSKEEKDSSTRALEAAVALEKHLRRLHSESKNTTFRLLIEQYFAWVKAFEQNLGT